MAGSGSTERPGGGTLTVSVQSPVAAGAVLGRRREALARGSCVGRYILLEPLGEGGMGVVFKAYDPELDRRIALKLVRVRSRQRDERERQRIRLLREAQAMAQLSHPNVIAVHDVGTFEDDVFIAMELVEGVTLKEWLAGGRRDGVLELLVAAGRGLAAAHAAGLIHRDFKPDNVVVGRDGRVRVLDFGLARAQRGAASGGEPDGAALRAADESTDDGGRGDGGSAALERAASPPLAREASPSSEAPPGSGDTLAGASTAAAGSVDHAAGGSPRLLQVALTRAGTVLGTPTYMAPEQLVGAAVDARADQFSFCVALCEAVYGGPPPSDWSELPAHLRQSPGGARVPARVRRALARGLALDPCDRYPSMDALLADLAPQPARQRRWAVLAAALAALVAAGALVLGPAGSAHPSAADAGAAICRAAGDKLAEVWGAGARGAIDRAFAASGSRLAGAAAERAAAALDAYGAAWSRMRVEACRATRVTGEQSEHMLDLRMQCLDRRLGALGALVRVLGEGPDAALVARAPQAARSLPALGSCADRAALAAAVPPPDDARVAAQVAALRPRLDRIEALERAGRYADGVEQARAAAADAAALGYAPVEAEATYLHGSLLRFSGDMAGSEAALRRALRRAADARDDVLVARAATYLIYVIGAGQSRPDEGLSLADFAAAAVSRAGDGDVLRAQLANNIGIVLYTLGRFDAALEKFQSAMTLWQKALGPDHPDVWKAVNNLAAVNARLGRYGESVAYARRGVDSALRIHGPSHPNVAMAYHTLGLDQDLIGDYDAARQSLERAMAIGEEVLGPEHAEMAGTLHSLATVMRSLGRLDEAVRLSRRSIALREKLLGPDHPDLATSLGNLGETLIQMGRTGDALRAFRRGLAIREKSQGADHPDVAGDLRQIAHLQLDQKRLAEAWQLFDRARRIDEAQHSGTVADSYEGLARVRLAQRRHGDAVGLLRRGMTAFEAAPGNQLDQGRRFGLLGRIYLAAGRPAEARRAFEQEAAFWEQHDGELPTDTAGALLGLGRSELALRRPREAAAPLERAIALLSGDRRPLIEERAEARFALAQALWPRDRARALGLARAAEAELAAGGPSHAGRRRAVRAWLAARRR